MTNPAIPPAQQQHTRWNFLRDALVFQGKLLLDGFRDLLLMPAAFVATLIDHEKGDITGSAKQAIDRIVAAARSAAAHSGEPR